MGDREWGPSSVAISGVGLAGFLMAVASSTIAADPPGRLLGAVAAVGLLVFAAGSWRARPRLAITANGLSYRGWFRTMNVQSADIELIRITEFRRLGRKVRLLEIDVDRGDDDSHLIVLSRWDLGGDPLGVLDALTAAGYAGRPAT
jgi:hypothetical protein